METGATARERIQSFINELARAQGIDPTRLRFLWDEQRGIVVHGNERLALGETFQVLTIYLGKGWRILTFPESVTKEVIQDQVHFHLAFRGDILDMLKSLKREAKQQALLISRFRSRIWKI